MLNKVKKVQPTSKSGNKAKPIVIRRVRCSWDTIAELEKGEFKDFGHMKLYCTHLSPRQVEKLLNAHGV